MIDLIRERLAVYEASNPLEEEHAVKEILQEIALYGLWRSGFFDVAAFQGGTCLRILYGMPRFSEDLDFILKEPDPAFKWPPYLKRMQQCFEEFGLSSELLDKSRMDQRVRKALLKDNTICSQLNLAFDRNRPHYSCKIKLEIDVAPPAKSGYSYSYLDFPLDFEICHQDMGSNFALKIHALLCRPYLKGRDWYDFAWYIRKGGRVNLPHLQAALSQWGPWENRKTVFDLPRVRGELLLKISEIDWKLVVADVERFLIPIERHSLALWNKDFFTNKIEKLEAAAIPHVAGGSLK